MSRSTTAKSKKKLNTVASLLQAPLPVLPKFSNIELLYNGEWTGLGKSTLTKGAFGGLEFSGDLLKFRTFEDCGHHIFHVCLMTQESLLNK